MSTNRKKPNSDLRKYYTVFLEVGLVVVLVIFIIAMNVNLQSKEPDVDLTQEQEVVEMKEVVQTRQQKKPPPPPKPQVPVEVPNDEVVEDQDLNLSSELDLDEPLPEPPKQEKQGEQVEEQVFEAVEQQPELIGGIQGLQQKVEYPPQCKRANIEGRVFLKFIVDEQGNVSNVQVTRGIGSACDQAAVEALKKYAKFRPGRQRGKPVKVWASLSILFRLEK